MTKRNECVRRDRSLSRRSNTVEGGLKNALVDRSTRKCGSDPRGNKFRMQQLQHIPKHIPERVTRPARAIVYQHRLSELLNREMHARTHAHASLPSLLACSPVFTINPLAPLTSDTRSKVTGSRTTDFPRFVRSCVRKIENANGYQQQQQRISRLLFAIFQFRRIR